MTWATLVKDKRLVAIIPDYLSEYFKSELEGIGSFFSSIAKGAESIGENLYNLGYKIFKYSDNPHQIAFVGANDISQSLSNIPTISIPAMPAEKQPVETTIPKVQYPTAEKLTKGEVLRKIGGYIDDFMKTVAKVGGALAGRILAEKIAKAAGAKNVSETEIYNRALAWATANQQTLQQMGYPSPEAAAASALWAKNGYPPKPDETPEQVLKPKLIYRKDVIEEMERPAESEKKDIEYYINRYWWLIAMFFALLLLRR